jgi:hypothetical protein
VSARAPVWGEHSRRPANSTTTPSPMRPSNQVRRMIFLHEARWERSARRSAAPSAPAFAGSGPTTDALLVIRRGGMNEQHLRGVAAAAVSAALRVDEESSSNPGPTRGTHVVHDMRSGQHDRLTLVLASDSSSGCIYIYPRALFHSLGDHPTVSRHVHASDPAGRSRRTRPLPADRSIDRVADGCAIVPLWSPAF